MKKYLFSLALIFKTAFSAEDMSFHEACLKGKLYIVKEHIKNGADINSKTPFNYVDAIPILGTPLFFACYQGHLEIVKYLIDNGANIAPCKNDKNILQVACERDYIDIIRYLITKSLSLGLDILSPIQGMQDFGPLACYVKNFPKRTRTITKPLFPGMTPPSDFGIILNKNSLHIFDAIERELYDEQGNHKILLSREIFGDEFIKAIDPQVDLFLLQQGIDLTNKFIEYKIGNNCKILVNIVGTYNKFKSVKKYYCYLIKEGNPNNLPILKNLELFFSRYQMTKLIIDLLDKNINSLFLQKLIEKISNLYNLSDMTDKHGHNLLWHILNKRRLDLSIYMFKLLSGLGEDLLTKESYEGNEAAFINISKQIIKKRDILFNVIRSKNLDLIKNLDLSDLCLHPCQVISIIMYLMDIKYDNVILCHFITKLYGEYNLSDLIDEYRNHILPCYAKFINNQELLKFIDDLYKDFGKNLFIKKNSENKEPSSLSRQIISKRNAFFNAIRSKDIVLIKNLDLSDLCLSRDQIISIFRYLIEISYDNVILGYLIEKISGLYNLSDLKDINGNNLLWHAKNLYNKELASFISDLSKLQEK